MKEKFFYAIVTGFVGGVWYASLFPVPPFTTALLVLLALAFLLIALIEKDTRAQLLLVSCLALSCALGLGRFRQTANQEQAALLNQYLGERVTLTGTVAEEPNVRDTGTRLTVLLHGVSQNGQATTSIFSRVLVHVDRYPEYSYGQKLFIRGKLELPQSKGADFDWPAYLAKDDIHTVMYRPSINVLGKSRTFQGALFAIKDSFVEKLNRYLPEPESSLAAGLIVGAKQSLGTELLDAFRRVGIIHMVVLSGYNLSIVADWLMRLLSFVPLHARLGIGALGIVLFTLMTGASAATVRAATMALIAIFAQATGRPFSAFRALLLAGTLMLIFNPRLLVFDTGFQLSFLATTGLLFFSGIIEGYFKWLPSWNHLPFRGIAASTIAAQLLVTPWILYKMGTLSIVALPVNLIVLPAVPFAMGAGFSTAVLGYFTSILAVPAGLLAYLPHTYIIGMAKLFDRIPFASVSVSHVSLFVPLVLYLALYWWWKWEGKRDIKFEK